MTATTGPPTSASDRVTKGTRGASPGCRRFQRSTSSASSRSALYEVALHNSTPTP